MTREELSSVVLLLRSPTGAILLPDSVWDSCLYFSFVLLTLADIWI